MMSGCCLYLLLLTLRAPRTKILTAFLIHLPHAQLDLSAVVETEHFDFDRIAELDHIGDLADPLRCQFADMHQPIAGSEKIHEGAEIDDFDDLAIVDDAEFGLGDNPADPIDCGPRRIAVD